MRNILNCSDTVSYTHLLVIALDNGNPVESRIVRDRFQKLCEENDYEVVVFHSLRHLSTGYKLKMTNGEMCIRDRF